MKFSQQNKNSIKTLFNQIAKNYDIINDFMSFGTQKFIKRSAVLNAIKKHGSPKNILDLCTGTGDIAVLFKKFCPEATVVGVDFSENMLNIAKSRSQEITFLENDITNLKNIDNAPFDICFISFGLRNLPNIDEFLESIKQYIKDDGVLSVLDLGKPNFIMKPYFFIHYKIVIPLFAKLFNKDISPYKYFIESAKTYPKQSELMNMLKKHGFYSIENKNFACGIISQQLAKLKHLN